MKRRAAIEPIIGHMKSEHRQERNRLKGTPLDKVNAILSAAAMNFTKLIAWLKFFLSFLRRPVFLRHPQSSPHPDS
jgi:IS5 family transposase